MISGMNIIPYWVSNFIVDYIKYLIVALFCFILIYIFNVKTLNEGEIAFMFFLLLIFYGFSFIPFIYLVGFCFKKPSKA